MELMEGVNQKHCALNVTEAPGMFEDTLVMLKWFYGVFAEQTVNR